MIKNIYKESNNFKKIYNYYYIVKKYFKLKYIILTIVFVIFNNFLYLYYIFFN